MEQRLTAIALMLLTAACTTTSDTDRCAGWRPVYPSRDDVMTPLTQRQVLEHNAYGAALCGWKPKG